jgi:putative membrane protein
MTQGPGLRTRTPDFRRCSMNSKTERSERELESNIGASSAERANQDIEAESFELSSRRTGLSFQRTRMSADRTLMSVIRTSLALIGFGFTIYQFFRFLRETAGMAQMVPVYAARNFGLALILLGVGMLVMGIVYHIRFMTELRAERHMMVEQRLVHGELSYPISMTLITAVLLLLLGLAAIFSMVARVGPFN